MISGELTINKIFCSRTLYNMGILASTFLTISLLITLTNHLSFSFAQPASSSNNSNTTSVGTNTTSTSVGTNTTSASVGTNTTSSTNQTSTLSSPLFAFGVDLGGSSRSLGTPLTLSDNSKIIFSIGLQDNGTYYKYKLNSNVNWTGWVPLGGHSKQIQAAKNSDTNLTVVSIGTDNLVYYKTIALPNASYANWIPLGGYSKQIQIIKNSDNTIGLFSIGNDSKIYYKEKSTQSSNWTKWQSLGGFSRQIVPIIDDSGVLVAFSIGPDNSVYYKKRLSSGVWENVWTSLGGSSKQISLISNKGGNLHVFSIGLNDDHVYYKRQLSSLGNWSNGWLDLGIQSKQIQAINFHKIPLLISVSKSGDIYYREILDSPTGWQLLLGVAKADKILTGNDKTGNPFLFMISLGYNQVFYSELLQQPEPVLNDTNLHAILVAKGLSFPTSMAFLGPDTILVLEKNEGTVRLIRNGMLQAEPVLRVPVNSIGERGLLGISVYGEIGSNLSNTNKPPIRVYIYYTESRMIGNISLSNRVYEYNWNGTHLVNPILILTLPAEFVDHNSGKIVTGKDGNIYTVIGDQNRSSNLQNVKSGKYLRDAGVIFRIKPDGSYPPDNPFVRGAKTESIKKYLGYGIRNSFGLAIDPITGNLWETENGETGYDELNLVKPGFNGGWKKIMGPISRSNITEKDLVKYPGSKYRDPKFSWYKQIGVTDLEFLNSTKLGKAYQNNLFVGDFHNGNLYFFKINKLRTGLNFSQVDGLKDHVADTVGESKSILWGSRFGGITDISTGPDGYLYILTFTGELYKIVPLLNLQGK